MPQTTQKVVDQRSEPGSQTSKSKLGPLLSLARDKSTVKMNRLIVTLQKTGKKELAIWSEIFAFWVANGCGPEKWNMVFGKLVFLAHREASLCSLRQAKGWQNQFRIRASFMLFPPLEALVFPRPAGSLSVLGTVSKAQRATATCSRCFSLLI